MKLTDINLDDPDEVATARDILSRLLGEKTCKGECESAQVPLAPAAPQIPPAPCIAAAAPSSIAPGAPPATFPTPPAPAIPAPPTALVAAAPSAPAVPSTPAPGVDVDKHGLPWDSRIHAESKAKIADGSWRRKRGVDEALVVTVEAELRGLAAPVGFAQVAAVTPAQVFAPPAAPAAAVTPAQVFAPPAAPSAGPATFDQLMPKVTAAVTAGILPPAEIRVACESVGVASIVDLQANPAAVPLVWAWLVQHYPALLTAQ